MSEKNIERDKERIIYVKPIQNETNAMIIINVILILCIMVLLMSGEYPHL